MATRQTTLDAPTILAKIAAATGGTIGQVGAVFGGLDKDAPLAPNWQQYLARIEADGFDCGGFDYDENIEWYRRHGITEAEFNVLTCK